MRILVTGGTGVVGRSAITALLQRGHVVRLFSRRADEDAAQWTHGVHPFNGDVTERAALEGSAEGCDTVLHLTGIVSESGTQTFERVNVDGTRNVVAEAERAGARKLVFVSSLGAEQGTSAYHESKRRAEAIVRRFSGAWLILRPGNVYGPGDGQISLMLRLVRSLPVLPTLGDGDRQFQPIWHEDLAEAIALAVERDDLARRELDLAGAELTSQSELVRRLSEITRRNVSQLPLPETLARLGARAASAIGIGVPVNESQMQMIADGSVIQPGRENSALTVFGITPTPLDTALRKLADTQEEQLPDDGVGGLRRRRYRADINGSGMRPEQLMAHVVARFSGLMASYVEARVESGTSGSLAEGATVTLTLPLRGQMQVRVEEFEPRVITLVTLSGHPLSGAVRFLSEARGDDLRFEVQVYDRAANVADFLMMRAVGDRMQDASWREMVENVVRATGGAAPAGVQQDNEVLDEDQAELIEEWVRGLALERKRDQAGV
jgi:NADH dehydrogenase